jgi:hypothetical protein
MKDQVGAVLGIGPRRASDELDQSVERRARQ